MSQRDSCENAKEFVMVMPLSNRIMNHEHKPEMQTRTLQNQHDIRETSVRRPIRHFSRLANRLLMGFAYTAIFC